MSSPSSSNAPSGPAKINPRRARGVLACTSCRKQKTRCEMLNDNEMTLLRCHRCTILDLKCSLEINAPSGDSKTPEPKVVYVDYNSLSQAFDERIPGFSDGHPLDMSGKPKRLMHTDKMWAFLSPDIRDSVDWSAPMQAMQDLIVRVHGPSAPLAAISQTSLESLIDPGRTGELNDLFVRYYDPWLNFTSLRGSFTPILDIIRCAVASRHLPSPTRHVLAPKIQKLAEDRIASLIFNTPPPTVEMIQAILIFSLWGPVQNVAQGGIRDSRTLLSSAVSMALSLHLNQASTLLMDRRLEDAGEIRAQAQLWLSLCNAESLLCIGTGRRPVSRRSGADRAVFEDSQCGTIDGCRERRAHHLAELCDVTEHAWLIDLTSSEAGPSAIAAENWHENVTNVLERLTLIHDSLSPLAATASYEHFYFSMLKLQSTWCQLSVLYHTLYEARYAHRHFVTDLAWIHQFRPKGVDVIPKLGRTAFYHAKSTMELVLLADSSLLATAPDNFFTQLSWAAALVLGINSLRHQMVDTISTVGVPETILSKVVEKWSPESSVHGALSPDHPAAKSGRLVDLILKARLQEAEQIFQRWTAEQAPAPIPSPGIGQMAPPTYSSPTPPIARSTYGQAEMLARSGTPQAGTVYPNHESFAIFDQLMMSAVSDVEREREWQGRSG